MKRTLLLLLLIISTPAFAITIKAPGREQRRRHRDRDHRPDLGRLAGGTVLVGTFESKFDRGVAGKLGGGLRNAMMPSYDLAPTLDLGELFAETRARKRRSSV